jgi:hypothetical protein
MSKAVKLLVLISIMMSAGCATSHHGTFVASTYLDPTEGYKGQFIGAVRGESRQTWVLYLFPRGEAPSTSKAIEDAQSKYADIKILTDVSIDDETHWKIGYSIRVIEVEANAYK